MEVPNYVRDVLKDMPESARPMDVLITAITILEDRSAFRRRHDEGLKSA